jgi:hypothetical protein
MLSVDVVYGFVYCYNLWLENACSFVVHEKYCLWSCTPDWGNMCFGPCCPWKVRVYTFELLTCNYNHPQSYFMYATCHLHLSIVSTLPSSRIWVCDSKCKIYSHLVHITIVVSDYVAQIHGKFSGLIAIHFFTRHCIYNNGTKYDEEE